MIQLVGLNALHPVVVLLGMIRRGGCRVTFFTEHEAAATDAPFSKVTLTFEGPRDRVNALVRGVRYRLDHELTETLVALGAGITRPVKLHFEACIPHRYQYLFLSWLYRLLKRTGAGAAYIDYDRRVRVTRVGGILVASSPRALAALERILSRWALRVGFEIRLINIGPPPGTKQVA